MVHITTDGIDVNEIIGGLDKMLKTETMYKSLKVGDREFVVRITDYTYGYYFNTDYKCIFDVKDSTGKWLFDGALSVGYNLVILRFDAENTTKIEESDKVDILDIDRYGLDDSVFRLLGDKVEFGASERFKEYIGKEFNRLVENNVHKCSETNYTVGLGKIHDNKQIFIVSGVMKL